MSRILHPLLALIASATDNELAKYVEYLKHENAILRSRLPKQIHTTYEERQTLLKYGKVLGRAIEELISIVSPATFARWVRDKKIGRPKLKNPKGGKRKPQEIRELVIRIAIETGFGYTRIIGELRKLGIKKISRQTVRNILKEEGIEPGPDRTSDSWNEFLKRHGETLWGCDFFSVKSVTTKGMRNLYVLVFLCLQTREAIVSESTEHPNSAWACEQTQKFIEQSRGREVKPSMIIHDRDGKYTKEFTETLQQSDIKANPLPIASPNLNGKCERFIEMIKLECLAKFIIFGKQHLDHLVSEFTEYYNTCRSHTARDHLPPIRELPDDVEKLSLDEVQVVSHIGGLVKSFERKAA
ncbi:integrase core domain-containing protein [Gimesia aquarii]|uniref:Integrase core domain protein n=1 Tax=Gimesia aquarii TaxID=2527964 RepID=A0A517WX37_9PLAN|nr:DDE-type integrase/transposase/recombinase [Gimesia aquarii]QDU09798.1 Integrase core domain protein [Gimesia aquarii]